MIKLAHDRSGSPTSGSEHSTQIEIIQEIHGQSRNHDHISIKDNQLIEQIATSNEFMMETDQNLSF